MIWRKYIHQQIFLALRSKGTVNFVIKVTVFILNKQLKYEILSINGNMKHSFSPLFRGELQTFNEMREWHPIFIVGTNVLSCQITKFWHSR